LTTNKEEKVSGDRKMIVNLLSVVVIITVFVLGTLIFSHHVLSFDHGMLVMAQTDSTESPFSLTNLIEQGSPFLGDPSAPITIVDFSDFQCHLCARYVKNTEPLINETYIQTGQVALVFKHLPNRGFDSMGAHLENEQGKFWQFHKLLYENQRGIDFGWVNEDNLKKFASHIPELDVEQFNSCFESQMYKEFIDNDV
jgi:hypothetical protein